MKSRVMFVCATLAGWAVCTTAKTYAGPGVVGNGGDAVRCTEVAGSAFKGLYSLDYLMTYETRDNDAAIVPVFSWDESYQRLSKALAAADPDLASSFEQFVGGLDNFNDWTQPKIWREAGFGLVTINDQNIIRKLPANCYTLGADGAISIIQSVVQTQRPDQIEYDYDPAVYAEFKAYAPVQFSFLMVHEWLWELTGDVQVIRNVDFFLHSTDATTLTPAAFKQAVGDIGITLVPGTFKNVCDRNAAVRSVITVAVDKACADITASDVATNALDTFQIKGAPIGTLAYDDFTGLTSVARFQIADAGLTSLFSHALDGLERLNGLDLSGNRLTAIDAAVFANKRQLISIDLSGNQLTTIPAALYLATTNALSGGEGFAKLDLSQNHLQSMPSSAGLGIPAAPGSGTECRGVIALTNNQLTDVPADLCALPCVATLDLRGNPLTVAARQGLARACGQKLVIDQPAGMPAGWTDFTPSGSCTVDSVDCQYFDFRPHLVVAKAQPAAVWADARRACANLTYAGVSTGWRLPTSEELRQLSLDALGTLAAPNFLPAALLGTAPFWSSTPGDSTSYYIGHISSLGGSSSGGPMPATALNAFLCVR